MSRQDVTLRISLDQASIAQVRGGINTLESQLGKFARIGAIAAVPAGLVVLARRSLESIDALAKQADRLNVSTQSLQTYMANAALAGVANDEFGRGLQKMVQNIGASISTSNEATKVLQGMGLNIQDLIGLRADEQFDLIAAKIRGMSSQAEKMNAVSRIFGETAGPKMLSLIEGMGSASGVTREQLDAIGVSVSRVDAAKIEAGNDALTKAKLASEGFANSLAIAVAPWMEEVGNAIFNAGLKSGGFRTEIETAVSKGAQMFAFLADAAVMSANTIGTIFTSLGQTVGAAFAQLVAVANGQFDLARQIGTQWYNDQVANWQKLANDPNARKYRDQVDEIIARIAAARDQPGADEGPAPGRSPRKTPPTADPKEIAALKSLQDELRGVGDDEDKAAVRRARLTALYASGQISMRAYNDELTNMAGGYEIIAGAEASAATSVNAFADQAARNIQDITASLFKGEIAGKNFFSSMLKGLSDLAAELAAQQLLRQLFGGFAGSTNPFLAALGATFGGGRAKGGDIMPGKWYLTGEEGPELIAPKSAGTVIPLNNMRGSGASVRITNNIDARNATPEMLPQLMRMMRESEARTEANIYMALRRGTAPV